MARISAKGPGQPGRPPTYGPDDQKAVLDRIATGMTITAACKGPTRPSTSMVREWVERDIDGFASAFAQARAQGADSLVTEALRLSKVVIRLASKDARAVQAYRLRVDTLYRQAAALDPAAYGKQVKHGGTIGHAVAHAVVDAADFLAPDIADRVRALRLLNGKNSMVIEARPEPVEAQDAT